MGILTISVTAAALALSSVYAAPLAEAQTNIVIVTQGGNSHTSITQTTTGTSATSTATVTHQGDGSYSIRINQDGVTTTTSGWGNKTVSRRSRR